jgi:hypothetical protein
VTTKQRFTAAPAAVVGVPCASWNVTEPGTDPTAVAAGTSVVPVVAALQPNAVGWISE